MHCVNVPLVIIIIIVVIVISVIITVKKGKVIPITGHEGPWRDVDARADIFPASALERGRVDSPMLGHFFTHGKAHVLIFTGG